MKYKGTINIRIINGKYYYYHQYLDNGKQVSKTLSEVDAYYLGFKIYFPGEDVDSFLKHQFHFSTSFGASLYLLAKNYKDFKTRDIFNDIQEDFAKDHLNKVLVLYGLRRTGKTTLIFQTVNNLSYKDFFKAAYIKIDVNRSFYDLLDDIKYLISNGFKYIFIDEITLLEDFISLSSTLSDIYASMAKIVLSGTDSLGFMIASHHELYNRSILYHTTYISYKEFSRVLDIKSIDKYIEYGGTMCMEGIDYNKQIIINSKPVNEYVDSSIAHNIIHSLKVFEDGRYFSKLFPLYEKGELENVINRIIEDNNHRFAISVIERNFKSHDYGSLKQLAESKNNAKYLSGVLSNVDEDKLNKDLMKALNIINKEEQTIKIDLDVIKEVEQFLYDLDVIKSIDVIDILTFIKDIRVIFTQPGLRYAQAKALVDILLNEPSLLSYPKAILDLLKEKLLSDVKGRMIEDIVLFEKGSKGPLESFKVRFGIKGEYDLAVINDKEMNAYIYEVKHSSIIDENQYKYLLDEEMEEIFEIKYYPIVQRTVLYRGESKTLDNGINYQNIEEFLAS